MDYAQYMAELEGFFAPLAGTITDFGARHDLLLQKYHHEAPMWSLCFRHPAGGQARLDVARAEDGRLSVGTTWWRDDYDAFTRSVRNGRAIAVERNHEALAKQLEQSLSDVLAWQPGAWTQVAGGYKGIWDRAWTKDKFERLADEWPRPK